MSPTFTMASGCVGDFGMMGFGDNAGGDSKLCMMQWESHSHKHKLQQIYSAKIAHSSLSGKTLRCVNGVALPVVLAMTAQPVQVVMMKESLLASLFAHNSASSCVIYRLLLFILCVVCLENFF